VNAHYRTGLNFAFSALEDARRSLARVDECVDKLEAAAAGAAGDLAAAPEFAAKCLADFTAAVADDLNLPRGFAALFELVRGANAAMQSGGLKPADAAAVLAVFRRMDEVLGVVFFGRAKAEAVPAEIQALVDRRAAARAAKDWAESDKIRDELAAAGWAIKDSKSGQQLSRI